MPACLQSPRPPDAARVRPETMKTNDAARPDRQGPRDAAHHLFAGGPGTSRPHVSESGSLDQDMSGVRHIEVNLRDVDQLFNTMDPSPFHERDLDDDAAEFILSWAREFHRAEPVDLIIHVETLPEGRATQRVVEDAVRNYFAYRARLNALDFKRLMKEGRVSLFVGLSFLGMCYLVLELVVSKSDSTFLGFLKEGLTIAGWVAMWRPFEIYLYEWWPLRRRGQILEKLSRMAVRVQKRN